MTVPPSTEKRYALRRGIRGLMSDQPVVNLYPDDPRHPTVWLSGDTGAPTVALRKAPGGAWTALFDRTPVAQAPTPEALTARLLADHGLLAVLNETGVAA